jgi:hypothetical protein
MKKILFGAMMLCSLMSCHSDDKDAEARLKKAKAYCQDGSYSAAKLQIDSIRELYPKAYGVIKQAIVLMREVETREQSRNSIYCDSVIGALTQQASLLQKDFVFEKEAEYQKTGNWILPSQRVERNLRRSYLRTGVDEAGEMYLVSVYYGGKPIRHNAIRVYTSANVYAETLSVPVDGANNYSFEDGGMTSQVVSYTRKSENGVCGFIRLYGFQTIKVSYLGGKPYGYILDDETKKAILKTYALSQVLSDLTRFRQEKKVADAKLIYLAKKKAKCKE